MLSSIATGEFVAFQGHGLSLLRAKAPLQRLRILLPANLIIK